MMNFLEKIIERKTAEVATLKRSFTNSSFSEFPLFGLPALSLSEALKNEHHISLIAEVKNASPSKGIIRNDFSHTEIASVYMKSGVDAVSVLTDEKFFMGNISYLKDIAENKKVPLLRKEFIIDELQIYEARAYGADAVLLIAELLDAAQISEFTLCAASLGMSVLLELHSERQLDKIDFASDNIIGINNRNLETFEVDIKTSGKISGLIPQNCVVVSESGISSRKDVDYLKQFGIHAVLMGEYFMRQTDIGAAVDEVKTWCNRES